MRIKTSYCIKVPEIIQLTRTYKQQYKHTHDRKLNKLNNKYNKSDIKYTENGSQAVIGVHIATINKNNNNTDTYYGHKIIEVIFLS